MPTATAIMSPWIIAWRSAGVRLAILVRGGTIWSSSSSLKRHRPGIRARSTMPATLPSPASKERTVASSTLGITSATSGVSGGRGGGAGGVDPISLVGAPGVKSKGSASTGDPPVVAGAGTARRGRLRLGGVHRRSCAAPLTGCGRLGGGCRGRFIRRWLGAGGRVGRRRGLGGVQAAAVDTQRGGRVDRDPPANPCGRRRRRGGRGGRRQALGLSRRHGGGILGGFGFAGLEYLAAVVAAYPLASHRFRRPLALTARTGDRSALPHRPVIMHLCIPYAHRCVSDKHPAHQRFCYISIGSTSPPCLSGMLTGCVCGS